MNNNLKLKEKKIGNKMDFLFFFLFSNFYELLNFNW